MQTMSAGTRWLYLAAGITAALVVLGAMAIITSKQELASGKRMATITGEAVCLPHKKGYPLRLETMTSMMSLE